MQEDKSQIKILTIEDDAAVREVIVEFLGQIGYTPLQAEDGDTGLNVFRRESPDLILLDLRLPTIDGLDVLSKIKEESPGTPVIIVSGQGTVDDAADALKKGAWDYITKPIIDMQILDVAVSNVLERAKQFREKQSYQERLEDKAQKESSDLEQRGMELERAYRNLHHEIEERKRAEQAIDQERTFMQTILDGVRDPARIVAPDFTVMMMNQAALALLPSHKTSLDQLSCFEAYRQSDRPCSGEDHPCVLKKVVNTSKGASCRHTDKSEDGSERTYELEASPLWNADGSLHGILEVIRNVTGDLSVEAQLREHQERLYHLV
ncbi:MAG: response regulator, partial [Proteobacteria bacterium]|nr:response regulator [Pseudomonadota bacterium]